MNARRVVQGRFRGLLVAGIAVITLGFAGSTRAENFSAQTIAARQRFFGFDNVNPRTGAVRNDRVIISWYGVSSFAASFSGHVVLLDGFMARGRSGTWRHNKNYVGTDLPEIAALKPEAYFFGHGHSDHAGNLPALVRLMPDVPLFGAQEHCSDIENEVRDVRFSCTPVFRAGASFGEVAELPPSLLPGVGITAVRQPHSSRSPDPVANPPFDTMQVKVRDCAAFNLYPPDGTEPTPWGGPTSGTVSISWQFRVGNFALVWSDTTGDISLTAVPEAFASLPQTNVLFGSIAVSPRIVFNQHVMALRPQIFLPIHHDPCAYDVKKQMDDQLATVPAAIRPRLWYLTDPGDYLRPIAFDPSSPAWNR